MSKPMRELGSDYLEQIGNHNPDLEELAGIRTQKEFAAKYTVDEDTLSLWNHHPIPEKYADISWKTWLKELNREIAQGLYQGFQQRKDPATAKLLFEITGEYIQKQELQVNGTQELFGNVKELLDTIKGETT